MEVRTMGVIGAGTMGVGIAQVAAQAGISVRVTDISEQTLAAAQRCLDASLAGGIERGKISADQADGIQARITWHVSDADLVDADWIIEAVFEDISVKETVLRRVSSIVGAETPIGTNTSTLPIAALAEFCRGPERFIGIHFFNPAPAMQLVEVIPGPHTRPGVAQAAVALCMHLGKTPVLAPDIPGFIVNRVFAAVVAAAVDVWAGGTPAAVVDQAVELGLAHKMGPLRSADLVGLDIILAILRSLRKQTGDARFTVPEKFVELVESGKHGRKSGEGFYRYGD